MKVVGTFCLYVPDEIIFAAGADRVVLCGGRTETIPVAEQSLPRNICPLIKSSFGAVVDACCGGTLSCPHVPLVDVVVAEATCDGKKKMYEVLDEYVPTYVLDLPQNQSPWRWRTSSPAPSLGVHGGSDRDRRDHDALRREIRWRTRPNGPAPALRLRRRDPPPIRDRCPP
jgi:hypothetical protein